VHRLRPGDRGRRGAPVADPKQVVRAGYDAIADRYAEWSASFETPVGAWLEKFVDRLPSGGRVAELGCGGENPSTRLLVSRYDYLGVDISPEQLSRARRAFPGARFVLGDATDVELEPASFDGVVSLFMFGHVPRAEQKPLLGRIAGWLRAPMFFASFDEDTDRHVLTGAGFELVDTRVVPFEEPGHGLVRFMWVLARLGPSAT
jgi:2-polyprenyl-3-methyl-5-hydroxy-6-metoxy-1,4-benzoquinol methylase